MNRHLLLTTMAGLTILTASCGDPQLGRQSVEKVIGAMTLDEKVQMVTGTNRGYNTPPPSPPGTIVRPVHEESKRLAQQSGQQPEGNVPTAFTRGRVSGTAAESYCIPRLNIPVMEFADGPAGLRIQPHRDGDTAEYYCTAFPTGTLLAASWDVDMVRRITEAMGNEVREYGVDYLLAPAINIHRNPLCGRNFEYYSEDPLLTGRIAAAYINGVQSNDVGVALKHFAVNSQETMRNGIDAQVSERAMREIYLRGFEIAVREAHPWTVMTSYNRINGVFASENEWLINKVLRDEWGFDGFVMTDWWAEENGARQIAAGNDMLMPGTQHQEDDIVNAINDGSLDMALLDKAIANILEVTLKTPSFKGYEYSNKPDLEGHKALVRQTASQGMVLMENDGTLPLNAGVRRIAAFGNASYDTYVGGSGSGNVNRKYKVSLDEGLANAGYELNSDIAALYRENIRRNKPEGAEFMWVVPVVPEIELDRKALAKAAAESDIAVYTLSRIAGEGADRELREGDYWLSKTEMDNISMIASAFHAVGKKFVVVMNMGSIVDMAGWNTIPDAILHAWLPGQEAGNAIADVLTGKVNPSGKLPVSITRTYAEQSSAANFPLSEGSDRAVRYEEDIYVGYRYYDKNGIEPLYPFGYGLSYTTFQYDNLKVEKADGESGYDITLDVTNTGSVSGREIVQIYVSAPQERLAKPLKELRAFAKTGIIEPGKTETVGIRLGKQDLYSFNEDTGKWCMESGEYKFMAASSASDIRLSTVLKEENDSAMSPNY